MKIVFVVSQVLFVINLVILFILPSIFRMLMYLNPAENGVGFYLMISVSTGLMGIVITGPLAITTSVVYAWYKNRK
ncbi:hypothetical protein [Enterococcus sp. BWR-S5]|uniref:hypothetical protein n=1 Tax=Enterococcus sp. BWR-S5 TaxID=2787714 RepID=UPI001920E8EC|nr:hypothetical protein [Enterococcus sp. BWR-S5]MBL1226398.1 hypothetical protein [Enterococcus sp. BWR-S5]